MAADRNDTEGKPPVVRLRRLQLKSDVPAKLTAAGVTLNDLVLRHQAGDWGMVDDAEREYHDWAARHGKTVTSTFVIWIEGKAQSVFITTEQRTTEEAGTTYIVVV